VVNAPLVAPEEPHAPPAASFERRTPGKQESTFNTQRPTVLRPARQEYPAGW
jgi:hypothetical protein